MPQGGSRQPSLSCRVSCVRIGATSDPATTGLPMEEIDLGKALDEIFAPTDPPKEADLKNTAETPSPNALESILAPPYKNSNTISGLPITGSSLSHQSVDRTPLPAALVCRGIGCPVMNDCS